MHMADTKSTVSGNSGKDDSYNKVTDAIRKLVTRRQFLKGTGAVGLGVTTFYLMGCGSSRSAVQEEPRQIFVANALGMIVAEPSRCVGCRRCELACTEFNDGEAHPAISRNKLPPTLSVVL
jgi:NAD-dependent dihydropyrimidine dehydrogenase PreA subunit